MRVCHSLKITTIIDALHGFLYSGIHRKRLMPQKDTGPSIESLKCNFVSGAVLHRFRFGGGRKQDLPKAAGLRGGKTPEIVDATAGLGKDAFLLASLGAKVTLIERSGLMHKLLKKGMEDARKMGGDVAAVVERMELIHGDAREILKYLSPEVIMIDPMHPPRKKSALVNSEMRLVREIVGDDTDYPTLIKVALKMASNRVVLKLPRYADSVEGIKEVSHQILGKSTRYDVFMTT